MPSNTRNSSNNSMLPIDVARSHNRYGWAFFHATTIHFADEEKPAEALLKLKLKERPIPAASKGSPE